MPPLAAPATEGFNRVKGGGRIIGLLLRLFHHMYSEIDRLFSKKKAGIGEVETAG
jgi:hypothetical protein